MASGLQIWDEFGNVLLDTSDRLGRFCLKIPINKQSGSVSLLDFGDAIPFAFFMPYGNQTNAREYPSTTVDGNTISWYYGGRYSSNFWADGVLFIGVF